MPLTAVLTPLTADETPLRALLRPLTALLTPLTAVLTPLTVDETPLRALETPLNELLTPLTVPARPLSDVETPDNVLEVPLSAVEMDEKFEFRSLLVPGLTGPCTAPAAFVLHAAVVIWAVAAKARPGSTVASIAAPKAMAAPRLTTDTPR
jgi:hypothetical protein